MSAPPGERVTADHAAGSVPNFLARKAPSPPSVIVAQYGPFAGYLIGFVFWVFMAALSAQKCALTALVAAVRALIDRARREGAAGGQPAQPDHVINRRYLTEFPEAKAAKNCSPRG